MDNKVKALICAVLLAVMLLLTYIVMPMLLGSLFAWQFSGYENYAKDKAENYTVGESLQLPDEINYTGQNVNFNDTYSESYKIAGCSYWQIEPMDFYDRLGSQGYLSSDQAKSYGGQVNTILGDHKGVWDIKVIVTDMTDMNKINLSIGWDPTLGFHHTERYAIFNWTAGLPGIDFNINYVSVGKLWGLGWLGNTTVISSKDGEVLATDSNGHLWMDTFAMNWYIDDDHVDFSGGLTSTSMLTYSPFGSPLDCKFKLGEYLHIYLNPIDQAAIHNISNQIATKNQKLEDATISGSGDYQQNNQIVTYDMTTKTDYKPKVSYRNTDVTILQFRSLYFAKLTGLIGDVKDRTIYFNSTYDDGSGHLINVNQYNQNFGWASGNASLADGTHKTFTFTAIEKNVFYSYQFSWVIPAINSPTVHLHNYISYISISTGFQVTLSAGEVNYTVAVQEPRDVIRIEWDYSNIMQGLYHDSYNDRLMPGIVYGTFTPLSLMVNQSYIPVDLLVYNTHKQWNSYIPYGHEVAVTWDARVALYNKTTELAVSPMDTVEVSGNHTSTASHRITIGFDAIKEYTSYNGRVISRWYGSGVDEYQQEHFLYYRFGDELGHQEVIKEFYDTLMAAFARGYFVASDIDAISSISGTMNNQLNVNDVHTGLRANVEALIAKYNDTNGTGSRVLSDIKGFDFYYKEISLIAKNDLDKLNGPGLFAKLKGFAYQLVSAYSLAWTDYGMYVLELRGEQQAKEEADKNTGAFRYFYQQKLKHDLANMSDTLITALALLFSILIALLVALIIWYLLPLKWTGKLAAYRNLKSFLIVILAIMVIILTYFLYCFTNDFYHNTFSDWLNSFIAGWR